MWFDEKINTLILSPLAAVPEHRRKGLATIRSYSGELKKTKVLGATYCLGGVPEFYTAIGFETVCHREMWKRSGNMPISIRVNEYLFMSYVGLVASSYELSDKNDTEIMRLVDDIRNTSFKDQCRRIFPKSPVNKCNKSLLALCGRIFCCMLFIKDYKFNTFDDYVAFIKAVVLEAMKAGFGIGLKNSRCAEADKENWDTEALEEISGYNPSPA